MSDSLVRVSRRVGSVRGLQDHGRAASEDTGRDGKSSIRGPVDKRPYPKEMASRMLGPETILPPEAGEPASGKTD